MGNNKKRLIKTVYLKYGPLASIKKKKSEKRILTGKEEQCANQVIFFEEMLEKVKNEGNAFISQRDYLEGGIEYWKEKLRHETD